MQYVFSFPETLKIDMIAHIGLIVGPFYPSEDMKDTIDEPNDS